MGWDCAGAKDRYESCKDAEDLGEELAINSAEKSVARPWKELVRVPYLVSLQVFLGPKRGQNRAPQSVELSWRVFGGLLNLFGNKQLH